jgi:uncharacterized OB-fold protein
MTDDALALPAIPFLRFDDAGGAYLQGSRCANCGAIAPGDRVVCNACGARGRTESIRLCEQGNLYSYTIVHRSFPGVQTPFIAAVVDLEGGGALKGTLLGMPTDPAKIPFGMAVEIVYRDTGQTSAEGRPFVSYYFAPVEAFQ